MPKSPFSHPDRVTHFTGSIACEVSYYNLFDCYAVWEIARDYRASKNPPGSVEEYFIQPTIKNRLKFLQYLCNLFDCTKPTGEKRLRRSISEGFLRENPDGSLDIAGLESLRERFYVRHLAEFEARKSPNRREVIDPDLFYVDDRKYAVRVADLVCPTNMHNTRATMFSYVAIYGNRRMWSRDTQAKIMGMSRTSVIRFCNKAGIKVERQYLGINPNDLVFQVKCSKVNTIEAFKTAEQMYRSGGMKSRIRGRQTLQRRTIPGHGTCLVMQLPNHYSSDKIIKEVPTRAPASAMERLSRAVTHSSSETQHREGSARASLKVSPTGDRAFRNACGMRGFDGIGKAWTFRYLSVLNAIVEDDACLEYILSATGGKFVPPPLAIPTFVYKGDLEKSAGTPMVFSGSQSSSSLPESEFLSSE